MKIDPLFCKLACLFVLITTIAGQSDATLLAEPTADNPESDDRPLFSFLPLAGNTTEPGFLAVPCKELRVSVMAHSYGPFSRGKEYGTAFNLELRLELPDRAFVRALGSPRIGLGATMHPGEFTDQTYVVLVWRYNLGAQWFLDFEGGVALHNGKLVTEESDRRQLGFPVLFRLSLAANYRLSKRTHVGLSLDHISNGYTHRRNEGLDQLGLLWGIAY